MTRRTSPHYDSRTRQVSCLLGCLAQLPLVGTTSGCSSDEVAGRCLSASGGTASGSGMTQSSSGGRDASVSMTSGGTASDGTGSVGSSTRPVGDPVGEWAFVSVGWNAGTACGVKVDGTLACWGEADPSKQYTPEGMPQGGKFESVSLGSSFSCAIRTDRTIACWGYDAPAPPVGAFTSVSVGATACAVRTDGSIVCWGDATDIKGSAPKGIFSSVSVNWGLACGLRTEGTPTCWGGSTLETPVGTFTAFSVGFPLMCGVRKVDGTIACFRRAQSGCTQDGVTDCVDATPPGGTFNSISVGQNYACGVKTDGTVACWPGADFMPLPAGTYSSVSVGGDGTICGVMTDGTLACWGSGHGGSGGPGGGH